MSVRQGVIETRRRRGSAGLVVCVGALVVGFALPGVAGAVSQQAYVKASNTESDDFLGGSSITAGTQNARDAVAISGDTMVVGAVGEDSDSTGVNGNQGNNDASSSGAVYVYTRTGTTWTQQAYLKASNTGIDDGFGRSVAISGDTIVVGAPTEDSNATGVNGIQANNSASNSGAAYVFTRSGTTWSQQAYLKASNTSADDLFANEVGISGDTIVVGADFEDSNATGVNGDGANNSASNSGAAYVFTRSGTTWSQQAYLKASNTGVADAFGRNVAIAGDTIAIGAPLEDSNATGANGDGADNTAAESGAAYVFTRSGTTWSQQAYLKSSSTFIGRVGDRFGDTVAVSGDTLAIGAPHEDSDSTGVNGDQDGGGAGGSGAVYVFTRSGIAWTQQAYVKASNTGIGDRFGGGLALTGDTMVVGAPLEDSSATGVNGNQANEDATDSGAAYLFTRSGTTWSQQAYLKASNTGAGDTFGVTVATTGDTSVVGAPFEDSNAIGVNGDGTNNSADSAGAAYVFINDPPTAVADNASVAEDSGANAINVLVNDTDPDGGPPVTIQAKTNGANGTVAITGGGSGLTYTPNADYCNEPGPAPVDGFTYTLNGGSTAAVLVTVTCVEDQPSAVDDTATVSEGSGATTIDVLANDTDPDLGTKMIESASDAPHGTVAITGGGSGLNYTPDANYCNEPGVEPADSFTYTLNGGSTATVSVTVTCVDGSNPPPPGGADTDPPETKIASGPKGEVGKTVKFRFTSDEPGSTFQCKVPGKPYKTCTSPKRLKNLREGRQIFKVRAIDPAGNMDPTPAKRRFKVQTGP